MSGNAKALFGMRKFADDLRRLPKTVAIEAAKLAAPALTAVARATFDAGETPDGLMWAPLADGSKATLRKSGSLLSKIHYVAIGTLIRVALGVPYAKYIIGARKENSRQVLPLPGKPLPEDYQRALQRAAVEACKRGLGR